MAELEPLAEDWNRALAVVAHPDDLEFGGAAAVARWTEQGKEVIYCLLTSGEAGIDSLPPEECGPLREAEQVESARLVGVETVEFLGRPDGTIEYGVALRRLVTEQIRRYRPEIVITNNFRDTWPGGVLNQADHIATGRATLDAVRDAANRWIFPDAGDPWKARELWTPGSPLAAHAVDTTETFAIGVASLRAHEAYIKNLDWPDFDPEEWLEGMSGPTGTRLGTRHATAFEVFSL